MIGVAVIAAVFAKLQPRGEAALLAQFVLLLVYSYTLLNTAGRMPLVMAANPIMNFLAACLVTTVAVQAMSTRSLVRPPADWVSSVLAAAFVEEIVFRVLLPNRIKRDLSEHMSGRLSLIFAVAGSQSTFAVSHFVHGGARDVNLHRLIDLAGMGVLLYVAMSAVGLWFAVTLHALLNLSSAVPTMSDSLEKAAWFAGGVCVVLTAFSRRSEHLRGNHLRNARVGSSKPHSPWCLSARFRQLIRTGPLRR
jgi:membrane protease YdiL (CAAX protease family)